MVVNPTVKSGSMRDREREYNHWDKGWWWYDSQREYRFSLLSLDKLCKLQSLEYMWNSSVIFIKEWSPSVNILSPSKTQNLSSSRWERTSDLIVWWTLWIRKVCGSYLRLKNHSDLIWNGHQKIVTVWSVTESEIYIGRPFINFFFFVCMKCKIVMNNSSHMYQPKYI